MKKGKIFHLKDLIDDDQMGVWLQLVATNKKKFNKSKKEGAK